MTSPRTAPGAEFHCTLVFLLQCTENLVMLVFKINVSNYNESFTSPPTPLRGGPLSLLPFLSQTRT